ncbi:uncharacterized protein [Macrobrachium rosenbergii]|uniref:uncharacterized protein n=1 Tax=Macrobrachium rosenbergii TaxID=79674 RepID=UPI0034D4A5F1
MCFIPLVLGICSLRTEFDLEVGNHGGSLIYILRDTPHYQVKLNTPFHSVAVQINFRRQILRSFTFHPIVVSFRLPEPFLLLGDFDSRHPLWGDVTLNQTGNMMASVIEDEDIGLLLENLPIITFRLAVSPALTFQLKLNCSVDFNWRTSDDWHTSDHSPIIICTNDGPPIPR